MRVTIPQAGWLRGEGTDKSFLLRTSDDKRCCIGFLCQALGVPDSSLRGQRDISTMIKNSEPDQLPGLLSWLSPCLQDHSDRNEILAAYRMNDNPSIDDEERETTIQRLLQPLGFEFSFVASPGA